MKNPNGINLVKGNQYLVLKPSVRSNDVIEVSRALQYGDEDDAYYKSHVFGSACNVTVECRLEKHYD